MTNYSTLLITFISILLTFNTYSQKKREDLIAGSWVVIAGKNQINKKWSIPTVGILRHYGFFKHHEFDFFRTGITYTSRSKTDFTIGYGYLNGDDYETDKPGTIQHWFYQELSIPKSKTGLPLSHRYRFETRWISKANKTLVNNRLRYRLKWSHPLGKSFYATAFNEIFISFQKPTFNQNRAHIGIGYTFSKKLKVEAGYLKNHFSSTHYDRFRIGIIFKTDLK